MTVKTKICLTGGGTGGSVTPLLAVADELSASAKASARQGVTTYEFLWIGTNKGIERQIIKNENIQYKGIFSGRLRRYFSLSNIFMPIWVVLGFLQSIIILLKYRPKVIITAGGFVSVPVIWAGWLLRRKIIVHQQDARAGLANQLMAPFARVVTVTFKKSVKDYGGKARCIGNPVRSKKLTSNDKQFFNLKSGLPTILILGGGTGSLFINNLVADSLDELTKISQIIHVTGKGRASKNTPVSIANYYSYDFLDTNKIAEAYSRADIVISRCGMATLSELSYLKKVSILIPIPNSHQLDNARIFEEYNAAMVLDQPVLEQTFFIKKITELLSNQNLQQTLKHNISKVIKRNASTELAKIIKTI